MENKYKDLSNNEIAEALKEQNVDKDLIIECVRRNSQSINHLLNKIASDNAQVVDFYKDLVDLPENSDIIYYPNQDKIDYKSLPENIIIHIPEHKKRLYQTLDSDAEFFLKIRVSKVSGSLLEYQAVETKNKESWLKSSFIGSAVALGIGLSFSFLLKQNNITELSSVMPNHHMIGSQDPLAESYNMVSRDLKFGFGMDIPQLTNQDLKLIRSITDEKPHSDNSMSALEKFETLSAIEEVISPYVKNKDKIHKISNAIFEASKERKVDYLLFLSIMKVETTTFDQSKVSSTGDVSIAQIKPEVWGPEFERLGRKPLELDKLKEDASYAIDRMGEILEIQNKQKGKDPFWYARYHSKTPTFKLKYAKKVQKEYTKIRNSQIKEIEEKIDLILETIAKAKNKENESLNFRKLIVNEDNLNKLQAELTKLKKAIEQNKTHKVKKMVASL